MFFIIWGARKREEPLGEVGDWCPDCRSLRAFTVARHFSQPHVYGIPVGRWGQNAALRRCWECGSTYPCEEEEFDDFLHEEDAERMPIEELIGRTNRNSRRELDEDDRPRRRRRREVVDYEEEPRKPGPKKWLVVVTVIVGLIVGSIGLYFAAVRDRDFSSPSFSGGAPVTAKDRQSRKTVEAQLMGKRTDEVVKLLGRPLRKSEGKLSQTWYYDADTLNEETGKLDRMMDVTFDGKTGRVKEVFFSE